LVKAGVGVDRVSEVGAVGEIGLLIGFDFGASEEREVVEGGVGGDFDVVVFRSVEAIGGEDFFKEGAELGVLECAQAGGVEGFFVGDVVAGSGHEYDMR
jgi:hypothetical protein